MPPAKSSLWQAGGRRAAAGHSVLAAMVFRICAALNLAAAAAEAAAESFSSR